MMYRTLGRSGLHVSAIALGSWRTFGLTLEQNVTRACMEAAYENGINFFDGAEGYGDGAAEEAMGIVFREMKWPRDTLVISSKVIRVGDRPTQRGLSRKHLVEACDGALRRMGLDYLDLFFCHRPDPDTPLEETVHAMNELIQRGKIMYWGTSEYAAADLVEMYAIAARDGLIGPTMEQTKHNMFFRDRVEGELLPVLNRHGIGTTIYSPLAVGLLTGKYNDGIPPGSAYAEASPWLKKQLTPERIAQVKQLGVIARELDMLTSQMALAWCLKNPHVSTAITGASRPEQVVENAAAADMVDRLTPEIMERIEHILVAL
jgi:voltage-dependent potassium channel beta subunit